MQETHYNVNINMSFKVLHPNKRSSEHTQIMHMYLKIRKEGNKCHELPQYHQVLIELWFYVDIWWKKHK